MAHALGANAGAHQGHEMCGKGRVEPLCSQSRSFGCGFCLAPPRQHLLCTVYSSDFIHFASTYLAESCWLPEQRHASPSPHIRHGQRLLPERPPMMVAEPLGHLQTPIITGQTEEERPIDTGSWCNTTWFRAAIQLASP
jgi:hypothetical protein